MSNFTSGECLPSEWRDRKYQIFISYRRGGRAEKYAKKLYKELTALGILTFLDQKSICLGKWKPQIVSALHKATIIIVILDEKTFIGESEIFRKEIKIALKRNIIIVPILIDGYKFSKSSNGEHYLLSKIRKYQAIKVKNLKQVKHAVREMFEKLDLETAKILKRGKNIHTGLSLWLLKTAL